MEDNSNEDTLPGRDVGQEVLDILDAGQRVPIKTMSRTEAQVAGAWRGAGLPAEALTDILNRYAEPHRTYHKLRHIRAVLDQITETVNPSPELIAAALLHDVVYDPRRSDNEEQSANYARSILAGAQIDLDRIAELILVTKSHHASENDQEAAALLDADLAVLGGYQEDYDSYAQAIRVEYWHVEPDAYREGRRKILESFLARPQIFSLAENFDIYEETARANIQRELNDPSS